MTNPISFQFNNSDNSPSPSLNTTSDSSSSSSRSSSTSSSSSSLHLKMKGISDHILTYLYDGTILIRKDLTIYQIHKFENGIAFYGSGDIKNKILTTDVAFNLEPESRVLAYDSQDEQRRHFLAEIIAETDSQYDVNLMDNYGNFNIPYYFYKSNSDLSFAENFIPLQQSQSVVLENLSQFKTSSADSADFDFIFSDNADENRFTLTGYHLTDESIQMAPSYE
ncbi:MAG: hypothetical protein JSS32_03985 [Verrucomicrobia bacterium]|nr:hypothetical protein [Verrucomicrobiota bacterium]